jgi:hypothetical protein
VKCQWTRGPESTAQRSKLSESAGRDPAVAASSLISGVCPGPYFFLSSRRTTVKLQGHFLPFSSRFQMEHTCYSITPFVYLILARFTLSSCLSFFGHSMVSGKCQWVNNSSCKWGSAVECCFIDAVSKIGIALLGRGLLQSPLPRVLPIVLRLFGFPEDPKYVTPKRWYGMRIHSAIVTIIVTTQ